MGLFDKIKKTFDRGGIDIDIDAPDVFRWKDGLLPVAVQLTGDDEDERLVTSLALTLGEDTLLGDRDDDETPTERARRQRKAENSAVRYAHTEPVTLAPGQVVTLTIEFPLSLDGAVGAASGDAETPSWVATASGAMNLLKEATRDEEWYRLEVRPHVEGFSAAKVASKRIRNLRLGESGDGRMWTHRFGVGGD